MCTGKGICVLCYFLVLQMRLGVSCSATRYCADMSCRETNDVQDVVDGQSLSVSGVAELL